MSEYQLPDLTGTKAKDSNMTKSIIFFECQNVLVKLYLDENVHLFCCISRIFHLKNNVIQCNFELIMLKILLLSKQSYSKLILIESRQLN